MPKKKGKKVSKGARQNKRKQMQAEKQSAAPTPVQNTAESVVAVVEQADVAAPVVAASVQETPVVAKAAKPAETPKAEKKSAAKKPAAEKKPTSTKKTADKKAKTDVPVERKKPGSKPMTEEQKAEARKQREALKAAAANAKTTVYIQYKGMEDGVDDLVAAAKADYKATHKRTPINSIKIYVKPEEYTAYYVVNDSYSGKVNM